MARPKLCTKYKVYSFTAFENIAEGVSNVLCHAPRHWPLGHMTSSVTWPFACPWATSYRCTIGTDTLSPRDFEILRLKCIWVTVLTFLGHVTSSVTWPFACPWATSYRCSVGTDTISKGFWDIDAEMYLGHGFDLSRSRDVNGHVTWPLACPWATSYRCSIGSDTLSARDFEILMLKCIWVTVLTFLGHVTSSITWPFFPRYVVTYRWSVDTSFLTGTVTEIFCCKGPINAMSSQLCIFPV